MKPDHRALAELKDAFQRLSQNEGPREDCPAPATLWEAVAGEMPGRRIRKIVNHTVSCGVCAEAWRLAHELAPDTENGLVESRTPWWRTSLAPWALVAAVLLLGFGIFFQKDLFEANHPPNFRNPADGKFQVDPPEHQVLSRDQALLSWRPPIESEGIRYRLHVTTDDVFKALVDASDLEESSLLLPAEALKDLPSGTIIRWWVSAAYPDGSSRKSRTFTHILE